MSEGSAFGLIMTTIGAPVIMVLIFVWAAMVIRGREER